MAKLPSIRAILRESLTEAPSWIVKLLDPLNSIIETLYSALNRQITFSENIACQIRTISFTTSATYSTGDFSRLTFESSLGVKAKGLLLGQILRDEEPYAAIQEGVSLSWREQSGSIQIDFVSGLANSTRYLLTVFLVV